MNWDRSPKGLWRCVMVFLTLAGVQVRADSDGPGRAWDPRSFGARADGRTLDTQAIQAAIDACTGAGGGTVSLAGGTFLSGTIRLRSHVTLCVAAGAVLRGSSRIEDYPSITPKIVFLYRDRFTRSLIYAEGEEGIGLVGRGVVDGQGALFAAKHGDDSGRPYLLRLSECRNVQVRDLTFLNSARWLSHYLACENVTIEGVTIASRIRENRDGMDIDSCDRVRIANCDVDSGDDAIVLKATANRRCRRVTVTNCTLRSMASALKLGTESEGGFEDICFSNCAVYDTAGTGVCLGEVDGGLCERVNVSNITMKNVGVALFVFLGDRARPIPGLPPPGMGRMRDILLTNIQAEDVGPVGCSITGIPGHPVENVTLQNIRLRFAGGGSAKDAASAVPEKEKGYPKGGVFGTLPAYGLYCRHVSGLQLRDLDLAFDKEDVRPALIADDVSEFDVLGLRAEICRSTDAMVRLCDVQGALVHGCRWPLTGGTFVRVTGGKSQRIALRGNDLRGVQKAFSKSDEVPGDAVSTDWVP